VGVSPIRWRVVVTTKAVVAESRSEGRPQPQKTQIKTGLQHARHKRERHSIEAEARIEWRFM
jgi:hypothetical protein